MKVDVERFGCNNLLPDFRFMESVIKASIAILTIFHEFKVPKKVITTETFS